MSCQTISQCQFILPKTNKQCRLVALPNKEYCHFHWRKKKHITKQMPPEQPKKEEIKELLEGLNKIK